MLSLTSLKGLILFVHSLTVPSPRLDVQIGTGILSGTQHTGQQ